MCIMFGIKNFQAVILLSHHACNSTNRRQNLREFLVRYLQQMQWLKIKLVLLKYRRTPSVIYLSESFYVQGNNEQAQLLTAAF